MNHIIVEPKLTTMKAMLVKFRVNVRDIERSENSQVGRVIVVNLMIQ